MGTKALPPGDGSLFDEIRLFMNEKGRNVHSSLI